MKTAEFKIERKLGVHGKMETLEDGFKTKNEAGIKCLELIKIFHSDWSDYIPCELNSVLCGWVGDYCYNIEKY